VPRKQHYVKPKRFEFTLKTVITDVFVAQVYWDAVTKTWPTGSKSSITKCVVHPWNSTRSVGGRAESTSWTFRNQVYVVIVVSQVRRCLAGQRRVNETCQLEVDTSLVVHTNRSTAVYFLMMFHCYTHSILKIS